MKRKAITVLKWIGVVIAVFIIVEALRFFMWECYYNTGVLM